ncbi:hypothetical protein QTP70_022315 [Hemibagrus guttatus]|uniref:Synaptonemal complex protein 1 n=1 Tax=Hemibagrus guttatus TaxID=175788 RepID=A0AAE0VEC4_9TELE|nr:hypothetical protein QTP70_022315 [Hemibagrus guttatus]
MEKAFNFKLLVPPRHKLGLVSAVKPQDTGLNEDNRSFTAPVKSLNKCFEKETISNSKMVLPTESPRPEITKMSAVMPIEKEGPPLRSSQLYYKLFEEAEKIKAWKLKMDYDMSEKDRNLQENRRTIETQRKAIQELQFENESLSMKLEEQLNKNEDMRNKHNATRNLCNILKDTFERSVEKMSLFEADREETHGLFLQNHETIQRMVAAFESLRLQAEADQLEMLKAKEGLKQLEELKVRFENEYHMKEEKARQVGGVRSRSETSGGSKGPDGKAKGSDATSTAERRRQTRSTAEPQSRMTSTAEPQSRMTSTAEQQDQATSTAEQQLRATSTAEHSHRAMSTDERRLRGDDVRLAGAWNSPRGGRAGAGCCRNSPPLATGKISIAVTSVPCDIIKSSVSLLEEQLREKESQHTEILLKLHATQENFSQLQNSANQHILNCKQEQNELKDKLEREEQLRRESEEKQKSLVNTFEQTKEMYEKNLLERDVKLKEINNSKEQLALQIKEIQVTADSLQSSLESETRRVQELESEFISVSRELCNRNKELGIIKEVKVECDSQIQALKLEMDTKENFLKSFDEKIKEDEVKILQLTSELEEKEAEINSLKAKLQATDGQLSEALKKENELSNNIERLKKDISQYKDRYENLLERFNLQLLEKNTVQEESDPKAEEMKETLEKMKIEVGKLEVEKQQLQPG